MNAEKWGKMNSDEKLLMRQIPGIAARLPAVPGTCSAITLSRTYKASRDHAEAGEELRIVVGTLRR